MKVKNLLLAGLAVAAMTACSNDEIIDNDGIQTNGENAAMQINFQFPTTRVVSDGGTNAYTLLLQCFLLFLYLPTGVHRPQWEGR